MAVKINKPKQLFTYMQVEHWYTGLLLRAKKCLEVDDRKTNRRFFGFIDGLIKGGSLNTTDLRVTRELRCLRDLVTKSIDTGVTDKTLKEMLDEV